MYKPKKYLIKIRFGFVFYIIIFSKYKYFTCESIKNIKIKLNNIK